MAFVQPFIPSKTGAQKPGGTKVVSVYVDNSFSMEAINKSGHLLENAKNKAKEIALSFQPGDRFQLLTNDFEGKHQRLMSREEFISALNEINISPAFRTLQEVYARQKDVLNASKLKDKRIFALSDFQKNSLNTSQIKEDTSIAAVWLPLQSNHFGNIYIDTCWFESPVQQPGFNQQLHVLVRNNSDRSIENASLKLFINNQQVSPSTFSIDPHGKKENVFTFLLKETGIQHCRLEIEDYPVNFDDKLFFSFMVNSRIPSMVISGENNESLGYFRSLMKEDSLFSYVEFQDKSFDYSQLAKNNFVILNEPASISSGMAHELKKFMEQGGSLALFPSLKADLVTYNDFLKACGAGTITSIDTMNVRVNKINLDQGLLSGVFEKAQNNMDMPFAYSHYVFESGVRSRQELIMKLMNDQPFLSRYPVGKGNFYLFSTALAAEGSNLGRHALFVPCLIKMAINSQHQFPIYYQAGKNEAIETITASLKNVEEQPLHIVSAERKVDFIPEKRNSDNGIVLFTQNQVREAGNYLLQENKATLSALAFNYSRKESVLDAYTAEELKQQIEEAGLQKVTLIENKEQNLAKEISELSGGKKLWKLFLVLSLLFLAIETLLIRLLK